MEVAEQETQSPFVTLNASLGRELLPVSIVMPAYNEAPGIGKVIDSYRTVLSKMGFPFEIVVVDNNSADGTREIALDHGARVVDEPRQGYGFACIRALGEAVGEYVFLTEADSTFSPSDLWKLFVYIDEPDVDLVLGTRTTLELVEPGAKMDLFLHWGNLFLAKLIQIQFWKRCRLTDVGCTFRAIKREPLRQVLRQLNEGGGCFSPEMIIRCLKAKQRIVEIPVRYLNRVGESKITANRRKSLAVGLRMMRLILSQRFWNNSHRDT